MDISTIATDFLQLAGSGHAKAAFERYVSEGFKHHNPWFAAGSEPLCAAMLEAAEQCPEKTLIVKNTITDLDGQMVAVHSHVVPIPGTPGAAVVHIFRFDGDKIVELWDVGQVIEADCTTNCDGMF